MDFKPGQKLYANLPETDRVVKIHIMYVLDGFYKDEKLIIFRFFGKYKRWWHQKMYNQRELTRYINDGKD